MQKICVEGSLLFLKKICKKMKSAISAESGTRK